MTPRTLALALAGVLLAAALALSWQGPQAATAPHHLEIVGYEGTLWNGTVTHPVRTPLDALDWAAQGNFSVTVQDFAGFGPGCRGLYVAGIGHEAQGGTGGWDYFVARPGGAWEWQSVGAGCRALSAGDAIQWRWVTGGM
ncbi:MAG: hypothetical protein ACYDBQ_04470 [Thermoplasmatota archaeon]